MENLEIFPGGGLGELEFGMSRKDVTVILGDPDEVEEFTFTEGDLKGEDWHYDDLEISMTFDESNDWTLSTIATSSVKCHFHGLRPIGMSVNTITEALELLELGTLKKESFKDEDGEESHMITYPELKIYFWIVDDTVTEIELRDWV